MTRALALMIGLVAACGHDRGVEAPAGSNMTGDTQLVVNRSGDTWSLSFTITNHESSAIKASYMYPFTAFQLAVTDAGGAALAVGQPALDVPVQRRELVVPAGGSATLATAIRLRFAAAAPPTGDGDPFTWTIRAAPQPVTLTTTLDLPGLGTRTASASLAP